MISATPAKLKNGSWGARIAGDPVKAGTSIRVTARSGKAWDAVIDRVLWSGDGISIVSTKTKNADRRGGGGRLVGYHTNEHCCCGNWSGPGSRCLYSYGEAKEADAARWIDWVRE